MTSAATMIDRRDQRDGPLVTIITPAYNRADLLPETIESVLAQGYAPLEYLVLDDGSKDDTAAAVAPYLDRITYLRHENVGETRTVNKAFDIARGEIICVVNSDDPLRPGAIRAAVHALGEHPEAVAAYTDWMEIGPDSEMIRTYDLPQYDIDRMLGDFNVAMGPGVFFRSRAFDLIGHRREDVRFTGDLDYWFRLALHGPFLHIPQPLATHRTHPGAASTTERGAVMAGELVDIVQRLVNEDALPPRLARRAAWHLGWAHYEARHYCDGDPAARRGHLRQWLRLTRGLGPVRVLRDHIVRIARSAARRGGLLLSWTIIAVQLLAAVTWGRVRLAMTRRRPAPERGRFMLLSHVLPPSWSGQAVILGRLLDGADPQHYCVCSAGLNHRDIEEWAHDRALPTTYHALPGTPDNVVFMCRRLVALAAARRATALAHLLRREGCDAVIACTGDVFDAPAAALAARWTGVRCYLYVLDDYVNQWPAGTRRHRAEDFEQRLRRRLAGVIVPNELLAEAMERRLGITPTLIRNVRSARERPPAEPDASPPGDRTATILYTGAVYHVNVDTLRAVTDALGLLGGRDTLLRVFTAQPAALLESFGLAGPRIEHVAHVPVDEVERELSRADLLLIPFSFCSAVDEVIRTAAPGKMGDYLASGTPILAVVPGDSFVAWYLREHECGLVVDREDPVAIAEAIRSLLDDPSRRDRLVANARERARTDFDPAIGRRKLLELVGAAG